MKFFHLFKLIILRYYKQNLGKLCLTILGISLGLALFITTRSYSDTILSYVSEQTSQKTFGNFSIKSQNGKIQFSDYQALIQHPFITHQIAKVERIEKVFNHETNQAESLTIIGIDMINLPPDSTSITTSENIEALFQYPYAGVANNLTQLTKNGALTLMTDTFQKNIQIVPQSNVHYTQENFLFCDLSAFYSLFPNQLFLTEIDIQLPTNKKNDFQTFLTQINPNLTINNLSEKAESAKKLSDSFSVNLIFLSTFAILVSLFISYQFFNFTAASRQALYQKLLALGMKQKQLLLIIFSEIGLLFLLSFLLSIFFGTHLAKLSLGIVKETISLLYFPINPSDIVVSSSTIITTFIIGFASYLFNCIEPIVNIRFQQSFFRQGYDAISKQSIKAVLIPFFVGCLLIFISLSFIFLFVNLTGSVFGGYANMFLYLLGTILCIPALLFLSSSMLKKVKSPFFSAALLSIEKFPLKNLVTISALALAFSLYLSLAFFINSFRTTVVDWIEYSNWADVYIYNEANQVDFELTIPDQLLNQYIQHPDVKLYDFLTHYEITFQSLPTSIIASHHHILNIYPKRLKLFSNHKIDDPLTDIYISESFKRKFNVDVGDTISLTGDLGTKEVFIKDIFYSYGTDRGLIQMTRKLANTLFYDKGVHGLGLNLTKPIKESNFMSTFQKQSAQQNILLSSNEGLRDRALDVFDQTFQITWMLAVIAGIIATLSLVNYVSITLIDRSKELIQIRSIGGKHAFLRRFILSQVLIITLLSLIVAGVVTVGILYLLIETINKPVFGWTIQVNYTVGPIMIMCGLALFICVVTVWGLYNIKRQQFEQVRIGHDL